MSSVSYSRRLGIVTVTADDGTERVWPLSQFTGNEEACIAQTGNGINPPAPEHVTASQFRIALHRADLLTATLAVIAAPETDQEIKIYWEYEVTLNRTSPTLDALAALIPVTSGELDDLFRAAAAIEV